MSDWANAEVSLSAFIDANEQSPNHPLPETLPLEKGGGWGKLMAIGCSLLAILTAAYEVARSYSSGEQAADSEQRAA